MPECRRRREEDKPSGSKGRRPVDGNGDRELAKGSTAATGQTTSSVAGRLRHGRVQCYGGGTHAG